MTAPACPAWCVTSDEPDHWLHGYEALHRRDFGPHVRAYVGEAVYEDGTRELYPATVVVDQVRVEMEGETLFEPEDAIQVGHQLMRAGGFARSPRTWDRPAPRDDESDSSEV